jgi:hypothetical protein
MDVYLSQSNLFLLQVSARGPLPPVNSIANLWKRVLLILFVSFITRSSEGERERERERALCSVHANKVGHTAGSSIIEGTNNYVVDLKKLPMRL